MTDTWDWNGSYWLEHFGITPPPVSFSMALAYDRARQRVVLHGGSLNGNDSGGVFEFDGTSWLARTTSGGPTSVVRPSMVHVPSTGRMFLFGGITGSLFQRTRTIEFVTGQVAGSVPHRPGCVGPVGVPALAPLSGSRP